MSIFKSISDIRHDYGKFKLDESSISDNPFVQFKIWFDEALEGKFADPNAMVLSTVNAEGKPSSRVLLLKGYNEKGFVFYTNYGSRKGNDLEVNPNASILFFWDKFERQIRIEGIVSKITPEESNEYFQSRPYTSRLGAIASKQSQPLPSRFTLIRDVAKLMAKYPVNVPLPETWGGYRLVPDYFEFWQGRESRLHDRFRFKKVIGKWNIERLYP